MAYFKINGVDFSHYVNELTIDKKAVYNTQTNAAGDSVVDYINSKRTIKVGIIPLTNTQLKPLLDEVDEFSVSISFRNPKTDALEENITCIIPDTSIDYYTIQVNKVMYNELTLTFTEL